VDRVLTDRTGLTETNEDETLIFQSYSKSSVLSTLALFADVAVLMECLDFLMVATSSLLGFSMRYPGLLGGFLL